LQEVKPPGLNIRGKKKREKRGEKLEKKEGGVQKKFKTKSSNRSLKRGRVSAIHKNRRRETLGSEKKRASCQGKSEKRKALLVLHLAVGW